MKASQVDVRVKPARVRESRALSANGTKHAEEIPVWIRLYLHDLVNAAVNASLFDDALTQLCAIAELVKHHPGLREYARGFAGIREFKKVMYALREFSHKENTLTLP